MPTVKPAAEFQSLPLDFIVTAPLTAVVKAQRAAAEATRNFIEGMIEDGKPITVDFELAYTDEDGSTKKSQINAPLLSIVPVPHLRIDKLTIDFTYEISQTITTSDVSDKSLSLEASTGAALSPWVKSTIKGSVSNKKSKESTSNRSGELDIHVQASESPIPEGLERILSLLARSVDIGESS